MDRFQAMATFVRVVETGSFSAAARQLNVGQPAVSKTVAQLEERLQVNLLIRSTRGLTPSEAGQRFYDRARAALEEAEGAELEARGAATGLGGLLRLAAPTTFARLHVVPRLPRFLRIHPELRIEVILDDRMIDLVAEGVDLSLRLGALTDSGAVARRIASGGRSVVATPDYLARCGVPQTPADLPEHEAVVHTGLSDAWSFTRDGAAVSVGVSGRVRVSAAEGVRAAVLAGVGLTVASDWMFAPELESGAVRRVLEFWTLPSIELWAVHPTGRRVTAKARAFADFVAAELAAPAHSSRE